MRFSRLFQWCAGSWRISWRLLPGFVIAAFLLGAGTVSLQAETGRDAWLRYARLDPTASAKYSAVPRLILRVGDSAVLESAEQELTRGLRGMLGGEFHSATALRREPVILLGTLSQVTQLLPDFRPPQSLSPDGYWLVQTKMNGTTGFIITAPNDRGVLYGVFAFLSKIARAESLQS